MVVELKDEVAHTVKEVAVVSHHEQRERGAREVSLEPNYHLQVEMVGGFVQNEEVGFGYQGVGQGHALLLSAAQFAHGLVESGDVQLGEDLACAEHPLGVAPVVEARVNDTLVGIEAWSLVKIAQPDVVAEDDGTLVIALVAGDYLEQGGLSRAVSRHEPHFLALAHREVDTLEKHLRAKGFRQILYVQIGCHHIVFGLLTSRMTPSM